MNSVAEVRRSKKRGLLDAVEHEHDYEVSFRSKWCEVMSMPRFR